MSAESDIRAILDDPLEPFETADEVVAATYLFFSDEMCSRPLGELWQEAIEAVRGADHDEAYAALDAIDGLLEEARARLRSVENGTAFRKATP